MCSIWFVKILNQHRTHILVNCFEIMFREFIGILYSSFVSCSLLKERIRPPGQSLGCKNNRRSPRKRECEEFQMAMQHKSKLRIYRELGFEEYLADAKGAASRLFLEMYTAVKPRAAYFSTTHQTNPLLSRMLLFMLKAAKQLYPTS